MTYNVHSCVGMDKKVNPERIAKVIGDSDPDIVAPADPLAPWLLGGAAIAGALALLRR
mgnify:CR=1 FL=1